MNTPVLKIFSAVILQLLCLIFLQAKNKRVLRWFAATDLNRAILLSGTENFKKDIVRNLPAI